MAQTCYAIAMQQIAVIGAGIAGLTVALRRADAGDRVVIFEASSVVGGQLRSERQGGFVIEHGAEGFVARSEVVPNLAASAGIAEQVVDQLEQRSFLFDGRGLVELAPGEAGRLLGFQVPNDNLGRGIRSFQHGMAQLPEQLAERLGPRVELRLDRAVIRVLPEPDHVSVLDALGTHYRFDAVVIATTARSAAALLSEAFAGPALALRDSALVSSLTVSLAYGPGAIRHPLDGTGFIVPSPEELAGVRAVTFSSSKLPGRAPEGHALLRLFFRPSDADLSELSDAEWSLRAERALAQTLPVSAPAQRAYVSRWPSALPVFDEAHRARVSALEAALSNAGIWLAGAAFHGSGIDAAIRSAEHTARAIANRP